MIWKPCGLGALMVLAAGPALAAALTVEVEGVASGEGNVLVAVCTEATFLTADCPHTASVPAQGGTVQVAVEGVPPGTYAVQAFHDANANMDLDRTFIGFPKEGLGFSNDAPMRFGPPAFEDAAIALESDTTTRLTMRYFQEP